MDLDLEHFLLALPTTTDPQNLVSLELPAKGIASIPKQLSFLRKVRRVNLSKNSLRGDLFLALKKLATAVSVNVSCNQIQSLKGVAEMPNLVVLNVSHNSLRSLDGIGSSQSTLSALVANDNQITDVSGLVQPEDSSLSRTLETVILSRNPIGASPPQGMGETKKSAPLAQEENGPAGGEEEPERVPSCLSPINSLKKLRKLSLSECGLTGEITLELPLLNELRLAKNAIVQFGPQTVLTSLNILDISSNSFESLASLKPCAFVHQLSLHGNPIMEALRKADGAATEGEKDPMQATSNDGPAPAPHGDSINDLQSFRVCIYEIPLRHVTVVDGRPFTPLAKPDYVALQRKQAHLDREECAEGETGKRKRKRHREAVDPTAEVAASDRVYEPPVPDTANEATALQQTVRSVKEYGSSPASAAQRGASVAALLKAQKSVTPSKW